MRLCVRWLPSRRRSKSDPQGRRTSQLITAADKAAHQSAASLSLNVGAMFGIVVVIVLALPG